MNFKTFVFVYSGNIDLKKTFKHLSKCHQCLLKKELESSTLSVGPSTNPNWDQSNGGKFSLETECSNLGSDSETVASSSEGSFNRYVDINEDNSALLDFLTPVWFSLGITTEFP